MLCSLVDDYFKFPMCAGVLAGIWPCGIITLLEELYRAEAKTQVYRNIHSFLYANPTNTSSMSEWYTKSLLYIRTHVCNCGIRKNNYYTCIYASGLIHLQTFWSMTTPAT